jgi:hypothetical protein
MPLVGSVWEGVIRVQDSQWLEVVVHPTTGEKRLFQADTEEDLIRQIAAWSAQPTPSVSDSLTPDRPASSKGPAQ